MLHPEENRRPNPYDVKSLFAEFLTSKKPVLFQIPGRNPLFCGRKDVLSQVHSEFQKLPSPKILRLLVYGLAGTGKKSVVAEYLHRAEIIERNNVYWFHADSVSILEREYENFMETRHFSETKFIKIIDNVVCIYLRHKLISYFNRNKNSGC